MGVSTRHLSMSNKDRTLYEAICEARLDQYAAHIATMTIPGALAGWVVDMTARYGPEVRVGAVEVDWITALMIVQYGEAVEADKGSIRIFQYDKDGNPKLDAKGNPTFKLTDGWPIKFTQDNIARAKAWRSGKRVPASIAYLEG